MHNILKSLLVFILVLVSTAISYAFEGTVVGVSDGDNVSVLNRADNQLFKIRLYGIDCPEDGQAFGRNAKQFTSSIAFGQTVTVSPVEKDRYGRTVALVHVNGLDVSEDLVRNGLAWVYPKYCQESFCEYWYTLERQAKKVSIGLWKDKNPLPPWEWRNSNQKAQQEYSNRKGRQRQRAVYEATVASSGSYHGNVKSHVFHDSGCRWYNCKNCWKIFSSRSEAISSGYRPCGKCRP